ncbi:Molybdopterin oxidoreductase, iron-sulfur binding subunit protein [Minicystis rosea]|nr:Molybdopterin oxidoreductase, iron-sulfur binding subunit protein [Minicystis rosea]
MSKRAPYPFSRNESGKLYWRSLGELNGSPEFQESLPREFPEGASEPPTGLGRRQFLGVMGASMALAGLAGCRRPEETIVPYSRAPEEVIPGKPLFFATSIPFMGTAFGLLVESHEGRPTKIEGNPKHPETLGASTTFLQAQILDMYDPDRSDTPKEKGQQRSWDDASTFLRKLGEGAKAKKGKGLAILTEDHRSPTVAALLAEIKKEMPEARLVRYEAFGRDNAQKGAKLAFGRQLETVLDVAKAQTIVAIDADILVTEGSAIKQSRGFAGGRTGEKLGPGMNRLYAVESTFTLTGVAADHRLRLSRSKMPAFAQALARELAKGGVDLGEVTAAVNAAPALDEKASKHVKAIAQDLLQNKGKGLVIAGRALPAEIHALVALMNHGLGNTGKTVSYVAPFDAPPPPPPPPAPPPPPPAEGAAADAPPPPPPPPPPAPPPPVSPTVSGPAELVKLANDIRSRAIDTVVILGGNPVFNAPADAKLGEALAGITAVHLSSHIDETSTAATWHLNRAHFLESWGDTASEDGTASLIQPLIAPLWSGRTDTEVLDLILGRGRKSYEIVRSTWQGTKHAGLDFERSLRHALHDGLWTGSASVVETVTPAAGDVAKALKALPAAVDAVEITFHSDPHAYDGRFANNGWMQELPDPMTKLTWGNVALVSPATAKELGVEDGDMLDVSAGGAKVTLPALIAPGQADKSIAITIGQGRKTVGHVGKGVGVDTTSLRTSGGFDVTAGQVSKTGVKSALSRTQEHFATEGRPMVREGTLKEFLHDPDFAQKKAEKPQLFSLWKEFTYEGHAWGLNVDLNACVGCNACVTACQAENNIPVVGSDGVSRSREMHWIRVDRYFEGSPDEPTSHSQPTMCQQCENAPCEQVCPVGATTHSPEGLNDMAYNRCIGTRYCANNCPFKVRKFNFFNYTNGLVEIDKMRMNPDVTVRTRGVMEKCTFCVQRINHAKIDAKKEGHDRVADGAVVTACQQACPTQAIVFGDLNDKSSKVAHRAKEERTYRMLEEINVRPRVSYMAKVKNPNPALEGA